MSRVRTRQSINESLAFTGYTSADGRAKTIEHLQTEYLAAKRRESVDELMDEWEYHYDKYIRERLIDGYGVSTNIVELLEDIATILVLERGVDDPRLTEFVIHEDTTA